MLNQIEAITKRRVGARWASSGHHGCVRLAISGFNLPGRVFCRPDGSAMDNVHVGVQVRRDPAHLVRADESETLWEIDVEVVQKDGVADFRGPAVQGKRGDRFIYLTWGNVSETTGLHRRLVDSSAPGTAIATGQVDYIRPAGGS
jgi:hypothetical protein